ncbi:hypothetical protein [Shewanella putrefaciens]|uniref:hypothetical protein n=1 Tax=Shewanella putrefaciens TaxID=24 RepID=UPI00242BE9BE|nr:hypothetical protein [Shewanella putrefaciens]MCA1896365.1 hypothetical protein [Shewanella putrefaciens]
MTETSSQEKFTQTLEGIIEQYSISEPPEFLKVLTALPDSPDKDKMFEDMDEVFRAITSPSELSSKLPKGTTEDTVAKELAKIPDSQKILSEEQQKMVELFIEMLSSSSGNESQIDMNYVRRFANADFPLSLETSDDDEALLVSLLNSQPEAIAEFMQAMMACHMAGMTKAANLLSRLFAQHVLIIENDSYQSLCGDITRHKGVIETSGNNSKKGQDKRHLKNRQRKEFALKLYYEKPSKNPKQAAERLFHLINQYAHDIGNPFSSEYQGMQTIYRWFLSANKKQD